MRANNLYSVDAEILDGPEKLSSNSSYYSSNNHDKLEKDKPEGVQMMTSKLDEKQVRFLDTPTYSKLNKKRQAAMSTSKIIILCIVITYTCMLYV